MFTIKINFKKKDSSVPSVIEYHSKDLSFFARKMLRNYLGLEKDKNYKIKIDIEEE